MRDIRNTHGTKRSSSGSSLIGPRVRTSDTGLKSESAGRSISSKKRKKKEKENSISGSSCPESQKIQPTQKETVAKFLSQKPLRVTENLSSNGGVPHIKAGPFCNFWSGVWWGRSSSESESESESCSVFSAAGVLLVFF